MRPSHTLPHDIVHLLVQQPLHASQRCILGVVLDWATLLVDPSGETVPSFLARHPPFQSSYTVEQAQTWNQYVALLYVSLREICRVPHLTLAARTLARVDAELSQLHSIPPPHDRIPDAYTRITASNQLDDEDAITRIFLNALLSLSPQHAINFFENIIVAWLHHLPPEQRSELHQELIHRDAERSWSDYQIRAFALEWILIMIQERPPLHSDPPYVPPVVGTLTDSRGAQRASPLRTWIASCIKRITGD